MGLRRQRAKLRGDLEEVGGGKEVLRGALVGAARAVLGVRGDKDAHRKHEHVVLRGALLGLARNHVRELRLERLRLGQQVAEVLARGRVGRALVHRDVERVQRAVVAHQVVHAAQLPRVRQVRHRRLEAAWNCAHFLCGCVQNDGGERHKQVRHSLTTVNAHQKRG